MDADAAQRVEDRIRPITPQLAWRVAVLGGVAFVLFGIVFFRLWFLQVLSGQDYVSQARENRVRKVSIEAPRGDIVDRNGATLVRTTRRARSCRSDPTRLPASVLGQADAYRRALAAAEARAPARRRPAATALERQLRERGPQAHEAPSARQQRRLRRAANRAAARLGPARCPRAEHELRRLVPPPRPRARDLAAARSTRA